VTSIEAESERALRETAALAAEQARLTEQFLEVRKRREERQARMSPGRPQAGGQAMPAATAVAAAVAGERHAEECRRDPVALEEAILEFPDLEQDPLRDNMTTATPGGAARGLDGEILSTVGEITDVQRRLATLRDRRRLRGGLAATLAQRVVDGRGMQ